jgi:hypothetical protein
MTCSTWLHGSQLKYRSEDTGENRWLRRYRQLLPVWVTWTLRKLPRDPWRKRPWTTSRVVLRNFLKHVSPTQSVELPRSEEMAFSLIVSLVCPAFVSYLRIISVRVSVRRVGNVSSPKRQRHPALWNQTRVSACILRLCLSALA